VIIKQRTSVIAILLLWYSLTFLFFYYPGQVLIPHRQSRTISFPVVKFLMCKARKLQPSWLRKRPNRMPRYVRQEFLYGLQRPLYSNSQWRVKWWWMKTMRRLVNARVNVKLKGHEALPIPPLE